MTDFLLLAFTFLVAGVAAVPIASKLGLGSVLGYLIAGIAISPVLAILGVDVIAIQHFAEFGVVMMLFLVGLELEPKVLWQMRARLLGLGGGQVGLTTVAVAAVAFLMGQPFNVALAIGLVLALSSTAIVLQTLNEKGLMKSDGGQSSFSVLLTQDIAVIPMLAFIPLLAMPDLVNMAPGLEGAGSSGHAGGDSGGFSLVAGLPGWQVTLITLGAIAFVVVGGISLTSPIFRFISAANLRELFTAAALMMVVGIALLMTLVGLSPALGTFLAGVVLANSEYRHELESDIDPFKGLLLGLFFMTVGAGINFGLLFDNILTILALTLGLIALKAAILLLLARLFKLEGGDKWLFALGLAQAGEFGFVLLSFTVANAVIPAAIADQLLLVVALSMLLTPALFILYDRVFAAMGVEDQEREADEMPDGAKIIIAGAGRIGGLVNRIAEAAGYQPTVIDYSSKRLEILKKFGVKHYYGDATRPDLLHAAGIQEAKVLVIAIDDREKISELTHYVSKNYPHVHIVARAVDRDHVYDLWAHGSRDIIRETYDSSLRMGRSLFEALGIDRPIAEEMLEVFNETDRRAMLAVADAHKVGVASHENDEYVERVRSMVDEWQSQLQADIEVVRQGGPRPYRSSDG
ncbi:K(+)/H(+) antiporter [Thalassovita autumnalis]|uniref:K(+)/H(+) antiporter n=1 Tax=Thalassovita autumnalis TaxID=2072972 RepID=A0A0P1FW07_9RHOB|nr:cation:proton antiporter [Thalassovita autumnalis]CUH69581.1 K(+)/H(+) antiporter [Thalassovita autumnalis]CUH72984.1 K(+)/H(+) antiporter [Thalassovita autumnalis]